MRTSVLESAANEQAGFLERVLRMERGCVADQPQRVRQLKGAGNSRRRCGWSRTIQPRSEFSKHALK